MGKRPQGPRAPAVAGIFYPEKRQALAEQVDRACAVGSAPKRKAAALIVPHGANSLSWEVAGSVYGSVELGNRFVILGPNHSGSGEPFAISTTGEWETPLGKLPIDSVLSRKLLKAAPDLKKDPKSHAQEHAAEMQLPFLQRLTRRASFVPVSIAPTDLETVRRLGASIGRALKKESPPVLMIASTLLTRYEPVQKAREADAQAIEKILALDEEGLIDLAATRGLSMCGAAAVAVTLVAAKELGASAASLVQYRMSQELTGDETSVAGFAGILLG